MKIKISTYYIIYSILLLIFVLKTLHAAENKVITINRIKIMINGQLYSWKEKANIPDRASGLTAPSTVISFLSIAPGEKISLQELSKELAHSLLRLEKSGYFFSVQGHILPANKYPEKRTLLIKVTEGFRYRFNGGEIYAMFGMENLFGKKKSLHIYAGYKFFKLQIYDYKIAESDFFIGTDLYYKNENDRDHLADYTVKSAALDLGYNINHALLIGMKGNFRNVKYNSYNDREIFFGENDKDYYIIAPFFKYQDYLTNLSNPLLWKMDARYNYYTKDENDIIYKKGSGRTSLMIPFTGQFSFNIQAAGGFTFKQELPYTEKFDLYSADDLSLRSGYDIIELTADKYAMLNFELRYNFLNTRIPPIFPLNLEIFLLTDLAYTAFKEEKLFETDYKDAYGAGLRIKFNNPVFVYFTFSYAVNHDKEGRFIYTGTAGF